MFQQERGLHNEKKGLKRALRGLKKGRMERSLDRSLERMNKMRAMRADAGEQSLNIGRSFGLQGFILDRGKSINVKREENPEGTVEEKAISRCLGFRIKGLCAGNRHWNYNRPVESKVH
jgi:hypothetical protein